MNEGMFTAEERQKLLQEIERLTLENERLSAQVEDAGIYKFFFDTHPDVIFKIDVNYIVSFVHVPYRTAAYIESVNNKNILDLIPDTFHESIKTAMHESVRTGSPVHYKTEGTFDGEYKYYENFLAPIRKPSGEIRELLLYSKNVTAQKNIERMLIKNQHTLKTIFENSEQFITVINLDRKIIWFNKKSQEWSPLIFGQEIELDREADLFLPEAFRESFIEHFNQVLAGKSVNYIRKYTLDSKPFYLELSLNPVYEDGVITNVSLIGVDITRHKENEAFLKRANSELTQQNEQLNEFSYIISHNLRGPIATLMGLVDLFENNVNDQTGEAKQTEQFLYHIKKTLQKLDAVIVDLNFVVTNKDESVSNYSLIDLKEECDSISDLLSIQIQSSGAEFVYNFKTAPVICSIKSYIHNILYNLISNAIKYKRHSYAPLIYLSSYQINDDTICIECKDNGIGLDLERYQDKLFGFYKRFHHHVEGKGIGLHLVKKQIELLKGKIEVQSTVDQGTTFKIFLPVNKL